MIFGFTSAVRMSTLTWHFFSFSPSPVFGPQRKLRGKAAAVEATGRPRSAASMGTN